MFNTLKTAALSAMIAFGAIGAMPAAAQADGLYLNFGGGNDARLGVYVGDDDVRRDRRGRNRDNRWDRPNRRECTPQRALNKAENLGVRRARVVNANRNIIKVRGRKQGRRVNVVFARAPNCPVIR